MTMYSNVFMTNETPSDTKTFWKYQSTKQKVTKQPKIFSFFLLLLLFQNCDSFMMVVAWSSNVLHCQWAVHNPIPFFTTSKSHQGAWNHHMASDVHIYTNHLATKYNLYSMSVNLKYGQCTCMETKWGELAGFSAIQHWLGAWTDA